ncbi:MAG TPA: hypothetical protein VFO65_12825 [Acidimicrobiales bacterium]|nr:hypothetical protein [Acidimicrobiales bacterium]
MDLTRIDLTKLRGLGDKAIGLGKEILGTVLANERMEREGEAQQQRATESLRALRKELEAEAKEARADAMEQRQKAAQRAKSA